jgi:exodeoxyribonuclease VII small subunit
MAKSLRKLTIGIGGEVEFSKQLERLEAIVRKLEAEDLDLDEALKLFEEGVERLRVAREQLAQAELKVKKVLEIENADSPADR